MWMFDGQGVEFSDLVGLQSLRVQQELLKKVSGNAGQHQPQPQPQPWTGWLSRDRQAAIVNEAFFLENQGFVFYAIEEGNEQRDIVLQRERLFASGWKPSWVSVNRLYLYASVALGCPACGTELPFGFYRRCGRCLAHLKHVLQCLACDHLLVGVDFTVFTQDLKCEKCDRSFRQCKKPKD